MCLIQLLDVADVIFRLLARLEGQRVCTLLNTKYYMCHMTRPFGGRGRGRDGSAPAIDDASAFPTLGGKST